MKRYIITILGSLLALGSTHARPRPPAPAQSPTKRVVLVHGFLETGSAFTYFKKRLETYGIECLVPKLQPSDGRGGLEALAERLKDDIETAYGTDQRISIIGFSMGGLVCRQYLQNLGGASRCDQFFTISSPHNGTHTAWLYPTKGAEQMRPGSDFLTALEQSEAKLGTMPVVSYRTPMDLIILPADSSVWSRAENLQFPVLLHPLMLASNSVLSDIEQRLLESSTSP